MCLAIVVKKGSDRKTCDDVIESITNAWEDNPDGGGIAYAKDGAIVTEKGWFDLDEFKAEVKSLLLSNLQSDLLIHLRYASAGKVTADNCHPFMINDDKAFIHNGTIRQMKATTNSEDSDTLLFGDLMSGLPSDFLENDAYLRMISDFIGTSKIAIINEDGESVIINDSYGEVVNGVWYSNDYYKKDVVRKATYSRAKKHTPYFYEYAGGNACYYCGAKLISSTEKHAELCAKCLGL